MDDLLNIKFIKLSSLLIVNIVFIEFNICFVFKKSLNGFQHLKKYSSLLLNIYVITHFSID